MDGNGLINGTLFADGFESQQGWASEGAMYGQEISAYDNARVHSGNYSGRLDRVDTRPHFYVHNDEWVRINNAQATQYTFSGWVYSNGPQAQLFFFMNEDGETEYSTLDDYVFTNVKNQWVYLEKTVLVPANIDKLNLRIGFKYGSVGQSVWFDDVKIEKTGAGGGEILDEKNYYPFGLEHKGYNNVVNGSENNHMTYNGKEFEESLGLNWLEYGARSYDPAIGRFMNIDRYAESFMPISTYQYAANNPVLYLDYNGDYITIGIEDDDGNAYSVLYENGKAYHYSKDSDGNITKGDEYDGKDNGFLSQAIADLDKVSGTKQGGRIVGKLQGSSEGYNISNSGSALSNTFNYETNELSYSQDAIGRYDGVTFEKSHIKLGHELAHAYDKDRGFDFSSTSLGGLPSSEINAVRFENYLRAQDGQSRMRLNYTYGGHNYNLRSTLGGKSAGYFNSYIAPLGRNEIYKRISPPSQFNPRIDNTYVRRPTLYRVYDTKKKSFVSFD